MSVVIVYCNNAAVVVLRQIKVRLGRNVTEAPWTTYDAMQSAAAVSSK